VIHGKPVPVYLPIGSDSPTMRKVFGEYDPVRCFGWMFYPAKLRRATGIPMLHEFLSHPAIAHGGLLVHQLLTEASLTNDGVRFNQYYTAFADLMEGVVLAKILLSVPDLYELSARGQTEHSVKIAEALVSINKKYKRLVNSQSRVPLPQILADHFDNLRRWKFWTFDRVSIRKDSTHFVPLPGVEVELREWLAPCLRPSLYPPSTFLAPLEEYNECLGKAIEGEATPLLTVHKAALEYCPFFEVAPMIFLLEMADRLMTREGPVDIAICSLYAEIFGFTRGCYVFLIKGKSSNAVKTHSGLYFSIPIFEALLPRTLSEHIYWESMRLEWAMVKYTERWWIGNPYLYSQIRVHALDSLVRKIGHFRRNRNRAINKSFDVIQGIFSSFVRDYAEWRKHGKSVAKFSKFFNALIGGDTDPGIPCPDLWVTAKERAIHFLENYNSLSMRSALEENIHFLISEEVTGAECMAAAAAAAERIAVLPRRERNLICSIYGWDIDIEDGDSLLLRWGGKDLRLPKKGV
jgi:hypothetical protein